MVKYIKSSDEYDDRIDFIDLRPELNLYYANDFMGRECYNICVQLYCDEGPFTTLTVNFGELIGIKNAAYIDTNNWPEALDYIKAMGIGKLTRYTHRSGFCEYPLVVFDESYLRSLDSKEYKLYEDTFNACMEF